MKIYAVLAIIALLMGASAAYAREDSNYVDIEIHDDYMLGYRFVESNDTIILYAPLNVTIEMPKELLNVFFVRNDSIEILLSENTS